MSRKKFLTRALVFSLIMVLLLHGLSVLAVKMNQSNIHVHNHSGFSLFAEPKNTIDVLAIGDSDVYSSISPLEWWKNYGFTGYSWGEPSQRISESYEYIKKIYKYQKPKIVLIEGNNLFKEKTDVAGLESIVHAKISNIFPVFTFHRDISHKRLQALQYDNKSPFKGYYMRRNTVKLKGKKRSIKPVKATQPIHFMSKKLFMKCVDYCRSQGSEVILVSVPCQASWNYRKHNGLAQLAKEAKVDYWDYNVENPKTINWKKDSVDGGDHLNLSGAEKVSNMLGKRLADNYHLKDRRESKKFGSWNDDLVLYEETKLNIPEDANGGVE